MWMTFGSHLFVVAGTPGISKLATPIAIVSRTALHIHQAGKSEQRLREHSFRVSQRRLRKLAFYALGIP